MTRNHNRDSAFFNRADRHCLPGSLGIRSLELTSEKSVLEMEITDNLMNFNGFVHGGSIVTLADTAAGYGCFSNLPEGATSFTTLEMKCNFIGTASSKKYDAPQLAYIEARPPRCGMPPYSTETRIKSLRNFVAPS